MTSLRDLAAPTTAGLSGRFTLISYFPTYAAALFVLLLVWAGAPGHDVSLHRAIETTEHLSATQLAILAVGILLVAFILHPLQLMLVRALEGYWPRWFPFNYALRLALARQATRRAVLAHRAAATENMTPDETQAALVAGLDYSRRYPPDGYPLLPTALGNTLRAMESIAGRAYGFEAVTAWPRLYPLLGERVRTIVDDRRTILDLACRLSAMLALTGVISFGLLVASGTWLLLAAAPFVLAALAYHSSVQAAISFGEAVTVAFDLHRFDLLRALHLALPASTGEERKLNEQLSRFWDQGVPLASLSYRHGDSQSDKMGAKQS